MQLTIESSTTSASSTIQSSSSSSSSSLSSSAPPSPMRDTSLGEVCRRSRALKSEYGLPPAESSIADALPTLPTPPGSRCRRSSLIARLFSAAPARPARRLDRRLGLSSTAGSVAALDATLGLPSRESLLPGAELPSLSSLSDPWIRRAAGALPFPLVTEVSLRPDFFSLGGRVGCRACCPAELRVRRTEEPASPSLLVSSPGELLAVTRLPRPRFCRGLTALVPSPSLLELEPPPPPPLPPLPPLPLPSRRRFAPVDDDAWDACRSRERPESSSESLRTIQASDAQAHPNRTVSTVSTGACCDK